MFPIFFKAVLRGLSVAAPVGPIGILCIRRTLTDGRRVGLACGLGAATADAIYALAAGLGMGALASLGAGHQTAFRFVGGLYLAFMAIRILLAKVPDEGAPVARGSARRAWLSTFALTITNPMTIAVFAAMFSSFGIQSNPNPWISAITLVGGVFLGSAAWWFILSGGVSLVRERLKKRHLVWINRISGACLLGFALYGVCHA